MKKEIVFISILLLFGWLILLAVSPAISQTSEPTHTPTTATTSGFWETFLKAPFALSVLLATFFGVCVSAFCEFWYWLFTGFDYPFTITAEVWNKGWNEVVARWWWQPGVTWHLVVSILFWGPATLARWGGQNRREWREWKKNQRGKDADLVI